MLHSPARRGSATPTHPRRRPARFLNGPHDKVQSSRKAGAARRRCHFRFAFGCFRMRSDICGVANTENYVSFAATLQIEAGLERNSTRKTKNRSLQI
eukprot:9458282-Pyramimonas_sp.AAC.1